MSLVCVHCGCSDIDKDPARGDAVCTNCGSVLEDQIIVSEVQFQENAAGGANVIGQYVSAEGGKTHSMGAGFHHGLGKESRQITLQNGQRRIRHLGAQLKLNQHCIDTAYNFFKMAVKKHITRGRKTMHVIAACLYLVCRTEGTPHMLLDFADILQANVYHLGKTYLQLSRELCINIPALDPCLYIQRFAHKLEFGEKTHDVAMTALRLVSRMKRDWMAQGRRPSGLCGAALLVASRIHNFNRSIKQIIKVVNIGEGTIRRRLAEFEATESSGLTIEEFQKIDLEEEADPPCFTEGRKKAKLQQLEESGEIPKLTEEVAELQKEIDSALETIMQKKHKRYGKNNIPSSGDDSDAASSQTDIGEDINRLLDQDSLREIFLRQGVCRDDEDEDSQFMSKLPSLNDDTEDSMCEDTDPTVAKLEQDEINRLLMPPPGGILGPRPTAASLGITASIEECMRVNVDKDKDDEEEEEEGEKESGELDLTDIDDSEIEAFILNEDEVKIKALAWIKANQEYLKEQKEKAEREAKEREENANKPEKKKRKPVRKRNNKEASTAGEAIERVIAEKKISSKINYDVLKGLTGVSDKPPAVCGAVLDASPNDGLKSATLGRFRKSSITLEDGPSTSKKARMSTNYFTSDIEVKEEEKPVVPKVIVESGPVQYEQPAVEEEADEDYEEDDEDQNMSAAALMGHGDEDGYDDGYDYDD